jgi:hypothetical protein
VQGGAGGGAGAVLVLGLRARYGYATGKGLRAPCGREGGPCGPGFDVPRVTRFLRGGPTVRR